MRLLPLLAVFFVAIASGSSVIDLSGEGWTVQNLPLNISIPGRLPSHAHLDLYAAKAIGDPHYGKNEFNLRWIMHNNWTYISDPIRGLGSAAHTTTYIRFDGLDTYTTINICGQFVANTDNQFRQYVFDISSLVRNCSGGDLVLTLNFGSAPLITQQIASQPGQETWFPGVVFTHELENRNWMRKSQSDFGWDWGPAFAPAGPWKPAYIIQLTKTELHIRNSAFDLYRRGQVNNLPPDQSQPWVFNASIDVLGTVPTGSTMKYSIMELDSKTVLKAGFLVEVNITGQSNTITGEVVLEDYDYELWWPHGMGKQKLYNISVEIFSPTGEALASVTRRMGFRTIVVNQTPNSVDQIARGIGNGSNWHFEINGHEFYAKGSNLVPPDSFWPRVDYDRVRMAIDGNQNFIRVWASGAYGPDYMYDIADELGLLLWTEFEFCDALYPVNSEFLANVVEEATYQVRRLNHHASLAVWVGGNEIETYILWVALKAFFEEIQPLGLTQAIDRLFASKTSYETLFLDTLIPCVFGNSRSISYMPSSTNAGYKELNFSASSPLVQRYEAFPTTENYADVDFYNYQLPDFFDTTAYPRGRFTVEFGYFSYPSIQTWSQVLPSQNLRFNDSTLLSRNHQNIDIANSVSTDNFLDQTNSLIAAGALTTAVEQNYPTPNSSEPLGNFSAWCQTTQIFQADFYRAQIQFYRWGSSQPWRNLGSLYWQLNDVWQTSSWSSIEYDGRWKYLHYITREAYKPVIIAPFFNKSTGELNITITSDLWSEASGHAYLTWYSWDGRQLEQPSVIPFVVGPINSTTVFSSVLEVSKLNFTNSVLHLSLTASGRSPNSNSSMAYTHENIFHPVPLRNAALVDPGIEMTYDQDSRTFLVAATKGIAAWTWLDYPEGPVITFDNNAFTLIPGQPKKIGYSVRQNDGSRWIDQVTVRSIWNNTLSG
ncbi:glycoside hydrolase family 2 protein [Thozetella sp. PMI_491]|nr:glycoside hydrolase family 2 protein [Thozetella sp. PMI_491]